MSRLSEQEDLQEDCAAYDIPDGHMPRISVNIEDVLPNKKVLDTDHDRYDSGIGSISRSLTEVSDELSRVHIAESRLPTLPEAETVTTKQPSMVDRIFGQDEEGDNQLMIAIIQLMPEVACGMIGTATSPELLDITNNYHQTAMHLAVIVKLSPVVQCLLQHGASPLIVDYQGNTPLHISSKDGNEKAIGHLTRPVKQDVNALNFEGLSCLHLATLSNHPKVMYYLIKKCGADINVKDGKSGRTALHYAAENNNENLVAMLLNWDADIESLTFDSSTPLRLAAGRSNHRIVQQLMSFGADPEALSSFSSSEDEDEMDMVDDIRIDGQPV